MRESGQQMLTSSFDELVNYGRKNGAHVVNGVPWSFTFMDCPVSHENDDCYLITTPTRTIRVNRGDNFCIPMNEQHDTPPKKFECPDCGEAREWCKSVNVGTYVRELECIVYTEEQVNDLLDSYASYSNAEVAKRLCDLTVKNEANLTRAEAAESRLAATQMALENKQVEVVKLQEERDGLVSRLAAVEKELHGVFAILQDAPELNPSNYDHDQVCELNSKMVEAYLFTDAAIKALPASSDAVSGQTGTPREVDAKTEPNAQMERGK